MADRSLAVGWRRPRRRDDARRRARAPPGRAGATAPRESMIAATSTPASAASKAARPRGVMIGEKRHAARRRDAEAVDIGLHGAGQHHAGPVVAAEDDGPLDRAGGQHGALGHDAPQALARRAGRGAANDRRRVRRRRSVIVIDAEHRRARHQPHVGQARAVRPARSSTNCAPAGRRRSALFAEQAAAEQRNPLRAE